MVRHRDDAALFVDYRHSDDGDILAVGINLRPARVQLHGRRCAGGLDPFLGDDLAGLAALGGQYAGRVFHLPFELRVALHGLLAKALAIEKEFDLVAIAQRADVDYLPFLPGQFQCGSRCNTGVSCHHER